MNSTVTLSNDVRIPQLGFGVYESPPDVCTASCLAALKAGYRHIDTAQYYANEEQVGKALQLSGLGRGDVFLTTKILFAAGSVQQTYERCADSVKKLDPKDGYVDLFLIHSPNSGEIARKEMWQALEQLYREGKARSIGVSNFGIKHIEELRAFATTWPPHVNQIELHPWCQQREIVEYCQTHIIAVEAYCPLVRNQKSDNATLVGIATKHQVSPTRVLVRYCLQKNWIPLPKSDTQERIQANADVFNFELDNKDMSVLDGLDQGRAGSIVQVVDN